MKALLYVVYDTTAIYLGYITIELAGYASIYLALFVMYHNQSIRNKLSNVDFLQRLF